MDIKQKLFSYFAATFFIALIIVTIYNYYQRSQIDLILEEDYFSNQQNQIEQTIDEQYPQQQILKSLPYYSSDNYFNYRITTKTVEPTRLVVVLEPISTDISQIDQQYLQTKSQILNWIISQGTVISDTQIKFYLEYNDSKELIETIN